MFRINGLNRKKTGKCIQGTLQIIKSAGAAVPDSNCQASPLTKDIILPFHEDSWNLHVHD